MKEHILVVDDDARTRETLVRCLTRWGCHVVTVKNAEKTLPCLTETPFLTVIINAEMPGGTELPGEIKSHDPEIQIMMMSDNANMDQVMSNLKHQAEEFVSKPVNPLVLEIALNRVRNLTCLSRKLKAATENLETLAREKAAKIVETERFVTVRQIVDKMSLFIAQIAKNAQGAVRYFNEMPYFVSIHSRECKLIAANLTYKRHLGNKADCNSWEIYSNKLATRESCPVGKTISTGNVMVTNATVRYLSGASVPVIVHTAPIFNNEGEIELVIEVFAGTKEIDRLAEEIGNTQQRYRQLFDAVPSYVAVLDLKLRITAVNRRFREDFGDQTGQDFFDVFIHGTAHGSRCPVNHTVKDGMSHNGEIVLTTREGVQYNMLAWTSPIKTAAGKLIQVLLIFANITELRKLRDNLASLGLMVSTLSHSLKGTLTGLDAGLYLIDSGFYRDKPGRIEEGLDVARLMAERIRKLVYDILYYAKERELALERTDILKFAGDVAANIETRIRGANIEFYCDLAPDPGELEIDPGILRSALINIFENAMEACIEDLSGESHKIEFKVRQDEDDAVFEITDNAGGMNNDQIRQMFNLFHSSKGLKGTGLGLFITKKVIQKHGGRILVDSEPGQGTQFHVRIPIKLSEK